jgi:hypothetical protein
MSILNDSQERRAVLLNVIGSVVRSFVLVGPTLKLTMTDQVIMNRFNLRKSRHSDQELLQTLKCSS